MAEAFTNRRRLDFNPGRLADADQSAEHNMLSVNAIYEDGKVTLLEQIPRVKRARAIVTLLDEEQPDQGELDPGLFDDLIGVVSARADGSVAHDEYLGARPR